jgi:hypothetical protein
MLKGSLGGTLRAAERAVLVAAAAVAFLATATLALRTDESPPPTRTEVLGARATRQPPTTEAAQAPDASKSPNTTVSTDTTLALETLPAGPATTQVFTSTTVAGAPSTTTTTASRSTTTTVPSPNPGFVKEQSDNTSQYVYNENGSGGSKTTPDTQPPTDPLTFLVDGAWDHDNVAHLNAKLSNNTEKTIYFGQDGQDGFVLHFLIDRNGQPWRTVDVADKDIHSLPAHSQMLVTGSVTMDKYGTYDLGGETSVHYS